MSFVLTTLLITLALVFFGSILLPLLPFLLIFGFLSLLFRRPTVRVYTRSFQMPTDSTFNSFSREKNPRIESGADSIHSDSDGDIIDAEYTETDL